jgi:hypothetical protein
MAAEVAIDGMDEFTFRRSIEALLREGDADAAARRIRSLLTPYTGEHRPLPAHLPDITATDVRFGGWDGIAERLAELDSPGAPVTAIGIDLAHAQVGGDTAAGPLRPAIEIAWYTDDAFPFSSAGRNRLLEGYGQAGAAWHGSSLTVDGSITIEGLDDLYGAVRQLERKCAGETGEAATSDDLTAGMLGACYFAVLVHQAVRNAALGVGLPRPLALIVGSKDVYPWFDVPVLAACADLPTSTDSLLGLDFTGYAGADAELPEGTLTSMPHAENDGGYPTDDDEEAEDEIIDEAAFAPLAIAAREEEGGHPGATDDAETLLYMPPPGIHVTGKQLRARFVTAESIAETAMESRKASLIDRLLGRA